MTPGGSGASGLGCFVEDTYVPADDCEGNYIYMCVCLCMMCVCLCMCVLTIS